ncbi:hypothetical protein M011DRAFT_465562 [Sporormia fimetaria CBS 119925]|uniref:Uncharacterized protein n=1 Tax=Sporormia fimetaria CBS 119925 TaxID=1340428 RepID=A0A6A6VH46_9PLEO|nr:hypothetical protein M011DRAFT_465562 [Sporormia fimetaria CBS 119925]
MPAETRKSNKDASYTAYYPKKLPKQRHFTHRRKIVRDKPSTSYETPPEPKQTVFLPENLRAPGVVRDSEDDEEIEEGDEDEEEEEDMHAKHNVQSEDYRKRKRRRNQTRVNDDVAENAAVLPARKRLRESGRNKRKVAVERGSAEPSSPCITSESEAERDRKRRRRRQSTMTQLVDGRRPQPDDPEPEFRPVRRAPRRSWGRGKGIDKDEKQRTLTQMVPGLIPASDSEEEDLEEVEANRVGLRQYENALAERFAEQGIPVPGAEPRPDRNGRRATSSAAFQDPLPTVEADADDENDEDYQPTQNIRTSTPKTIRNSRAAPGQNDGSPVRLRSLRSTVPKARKTRFSLLATPERRKIREIQSSQSPPDTPLSTQDTPGTSRLPLRHRTGNTQAPEDTPSKRKRVTFQDSVNEIVHHGSSRGRYNHAVEDSDAEKDLEGFEDVLAGGQAIGPETQRRIDNIEARFQGKDVGQETQAMINEIDLACEDADDQVTRVDDQSTIATQQPCEGRAEEPERAQVQGEELKSNRQVLASQNHSSPLISSSSTLVGGETPLPSSPPARTQQATSFRPVHKNTHTNRPSSPETPGRPSTPPIYIKMSPKDTPPIHSTPLPRGPPTNQQRLKTSPKDTPPIHSTPLPQAPLTNQQPPSPTEDLDLDGEPITARPSSPTNNRESQGTVHSHSSRAEQQLQTEWLTYSQYPRVPPSSSMHVLHDCSTSYQATPYNNATMKPRMAMRVDVEDGSAPLSQATTVDVDMCTQRSPAVTPKTQRTGRLEAARTPGTTPRSNRNRGKRSIADSVLITPSRPRVIPSSQPEENAVSPVRPDSLVIPSSLRSLTLGEWGTGQWKSLDVDKFSIPALPPDSEL